MGSLRHMPSKQSPPCISMHGQYYCGFCYCSLGHFTPWVLGWGSVQNQYPCDHRQSPRYILSEMSPDVSPENPSLGAKNQRAFFSPFRGLAHEKYLEATGTACRAKTCIQRQGCSDGHPECGFQGDYRTGTQEAAQSHHSSDTGSKPGLMLIGILPAKHWTSLLHLNLRTSQ